MAKKRNKAGKKSAKKSVRKVSKKTVRKASRASGGMSPDYSWVEHCLASTTDEAKPGRCFVYQKGKLPKVLKGLLTSTEIKRLERVPAGEAFVFYGKIDGDLIAFPVETKAAGGELEKSASKMLKGNMGALFKKMKSEDFDHIQVDLELKQAELVKAVLVGLDLAQYSFRQRTERAGEIGFAPSLKFKVMGRLMAPSAVKGAVALAKGINLARHLVNMPPNTLQPEHYQKLVEKMFAKVPGVTVTTWDAGRLKKEGMNLMLAVGQASESLPRLVHIKYRPKGSASKKPIALVGKGITFDTGGLDLKPAQYMRLMKKDMGGSAAVVGAVRWAMMSGSKQPLDVYLALAENSVSDEAFRPSDVVRSRSGHMVEIDNTDAEGRLVLADALDVAVTKTGKEAPRCVIDVATLTGAAKVAVGKDIGALFSNNDSLRNKLMKSGEVTGDLCWPLPLYQPYRNDLKTPFADFVNSAGGFGGSITAALFLQTFVGDADWAHLDIYGWNDGPSGCFLEKGGSGQAVALLADYLERA